MGANGASGRLRSHQAGSAVDPVRGQRGIGACNRVGAGVGRCGQVTKCHQLGAERASCGGDGAWIRVLGRFSLPRHALVDGRGHATLLFLILG